MNSHDHDEPIAFAIPDPVQWHEGMLLAPQHFQLEARRVEAMVNAQMRAATPFLWGVRRLEIDRSAMLAGQFRVLALEALFADGLILSHPAPGSPELVLDLKAVDRELGAEPATIHVAVAVRSERAAAPGALRRYLSLEGPPAPDENTGDDPVATPRLRPAPTLFVTDSPLVGPGSAYVALPLARVGFVDGRLQLLDYQPPLLRMTRDTPAHRLATELALALREKAASLADRLRLAAESGGMDGPGPAAVLQGLVAPLPRLEALLRDEVATPYDLYLTLCDVLGAVAGIDLALAPPSAPPYRHADALPAFRALAGLVLPAVARLHAGRRTVPLTRLEDGAFALASDAAPLADPFQILLRPRPSEHAAALRDWALAATIATEDAMAGARGLRVRGAERRLLTEIGALDIAAPPHAVVIEVDRDPGFLTRGARLELRHPTGATATGAPASAALVLPPERRANRLAPAAAQHAEPVS
jgi:type VI secretion system protein ImpJ